MRLSVTVAAQPCLLALTFCHACVVDQAQSLSEFVASDGEPVVAGIDGAQPAAADVHRLYAALDAFRANHGGALPAPGAGLPACVCLRVGYRQGCALCLPGAISRCSCSYPFPVRRWVLVSRCCGRDCCRCCRCRGCHCARLCAWLQCGHIADGNAGRWSGGAGSDQGQTGRV